MPAIVVPFRGPGGKTRLGPLPGETRESLALAMLADVLAACDQVGSTYLVTSDERAANIAHEFAAHVVADPGGGQGPAVASALERVPGERALVVNADLPCVVPHDLRTLDAAAGGDGMALVEAADGTTNALALARADLFAPLYGPGSAQRFRAHGAERGVDVVSAVIPNVAADVDTLEDLERLELRVGPRTLAVLSPPRGKAVR